MKMFEGQSELAENFAQYNITYQSHTYGIMPEMFLSDDGLRNMFTSTSVSYTPDGN